MSDPQSPTELPCTPLAESVEIIHRTSRKRRGSSVPLWDSDDIDAYTPLAESVEIIHRTSRKRRGSSVPLWDSDDIDAYFPEANEPQVVVMEHQLEAIQRMAAEMEQSLKTVTSQMDVLKGILEVLRTSAEPKD